MLPRAVGLALVLVIGVASHALAGDAEVLPAEVVARQARDAWEQGRFRTALDLLEGGLRDHPGALSLMKLRGDVLSVTRRPAEAVEAYEQVLARTPDAMPVRWAKWAVLVRSGRGEEAVAELERMARIDAGNPLIHLRLGVELRKIDRLEDAVPAYKTAVQLAPDLLTWRMGLARAHFDVLDYLGAYQQVQYVLKHSPPGSPLELPAQNFLTVIYGSGKDRGRRFVREYTPDASEEDLREWALLRGEAWRIFSAGRYAEAEPMYRKLLELNPRDPTAAHQLGVILMDLGRCEEALPFLRQTTNLESSEEESADAIYRTGVCLAELKQWPEALAQFRILYETAVEFEERYKDVPLPPGTRVLDTAKLAEWIERVRPHVPEADRVLTDPRAGVEPLTEEQQIALLGKMAAEVDPQKVLEARASLMGRDADFSWFRYVIPARDVMRDDYQTGEHEFIPIDPADTFPATQREVFLVFRLVTASYDEVPLTAQCYLEASELTEAPRGLAPDRVIMAMSDQSGYFVIAPPAKGWTEGLYRCGLFVGQQTSADTQVDEVRFRIATPRASQTSDRGGATPPAARTTRHRAD